LLKVIIFSLLVSVGLAGGLVVGRIAGLISGWSMIPAPDLITSAQSDTRMADAHEPDNAGKPDSNRSTSPEQRRRYVAKVSVVREASGLTYRVTPTRQGRLVSDTAMKAMWRQAVRLGVPNQRNLRQQFRCHPLSMIARFKPSWDLELWRPRVGLRNTMLAGCNPEP
jgi:hypothetical protein